MCGDCWNAAMGAPAAVVAARFAWVGYKDRIPFLGRRPGDRPLAAEDEHATADGDAGRHDGERAGAGAGTVDDERADGALVEAGAPPP